MQLQQRYFQPKQLKEENLNMNVSWKVTFPLSFLRLSEEFDTLEKNRWSK